METLLKAFAVVLLIIGVIVLIGVLTAVPIMLLLNWLIAPTLLLVIFGVAKIGFWKALGIGLLCGCLFKSTSYNTSSK